VSRRRVRRPKFGETLLAAVVVFGLIYAGLAGLTAVNGEPAAALAGIAAGVPLGAYIATPHSRASRRRSR
jgi:hypothetical protein